MTCVSPPRSIASSASDYGTCGSTYGSDSDDPSSFLSSTIGICPHCKTSLQEPLTLQCGHSFCSSCISELLATLNSKYPLRRSQVRMGLRSYNLQKATFPAGSYHSPACIVCKEPPKIIAPVPNIELQLLLHLHQTNQENLLQRHLLRESFSSSELKKASIRKCKVSILGVKGVGKSTLKRVQVGNGIVFHDMLGMDKPLSLELSVGDNWEHAMKTSDGFVLVYSITDRKSFFSLTDVFQTLTSRRGPSVPIILISNKLDKSSERAVSVYEGQTLSFSFRCPFMEVSGKKNDCVNEAFKELARLLEINRLRHSTV